MKSHKILDDSYLNVIRHELSWIYTILDPSQIKLFEETLLDINHFILDSTMENIKRLKEKDIDNVREFISIFKLSKN